MGRQERAGLSLACLRRLSVLRVNCKVAGLVDPVAKPKSLERTTFAGYPSKYDTSLQQPASLKLGAHSMPHARDLGAKTSLLSQRVAECRTLLWTKG